MATNLSRTLIRIIGAISLVLSLRAFYDLGEAGRLVINHTGQISGAPLFRHVFWTMTALNAVFLGAMTLTSIGLLRLKRNAVRIYTWLYIALVAYAFAPGLFWGGSPLGRSIAAASGVGGIGIAPLTLFPFPFVYAVMSVVLVTLAAKKIGDTSSDTLHSQAV
jgi:hypothetical protein